MQLDRLLSVGAIVLSGLMLAGCAQQSEGPASVSQPPPPAPGSAVTASSADESALPLAVSASFHNEFPKAGMTRVVPGTTETGRSYYRITYIINGTPGSVSYFADGTQLPKPAVATPTAPVTPAAPQTPPSRTPDVGRP